MSVSIIHSLRRVQEAIAEAQRYASEHNVALTVERLAACLGLSREELCAYIRAEPSTKQSPNEVKIRRLLCEAYHRIGAELAEELMKSGSHTGALFLSKNNFGYVDKADVKADFAVAFTGEHELPE